MLCQQSIRTLRATTLVHEWGYCHQLFPPASFLSEESAAPPSVWRDSRAQNAVPMASNHFQMTLYQQGWRKIYRTLLFIKLQFCKCLQKDTYRLTTEQITQGSLTITSHLIPSCHLCEFWMVWEWLPFCLQVLPLLPSLLPLSFLIPKYKSYSFVEPLRNQQSSFCWFKLG